MYRKVLVSDDLGIINEGVASILKEFGITNVDKTHYCDDAYLKIKKAVMDDMPYQLLITDLSFKTDYREQTFPSGESLIECIRKEDIPLKIIVFSVEDRLQRVRSLFNHSEIDAYICKGRDGLEDLREAIVKVSKGERFLSKGVERALDNKLRIDIEEFDIALLKELSKGRSQEQISESFKLRKITPNSLSSIEKHINRLKVQFRAKNAVHLISMAKDIGLI
jgi:DNA-binding NarL/FixJ family response regulator